MTLAEKLEKYHINFTQKKTLALFPDPEEVGEEFSKEEMTEAKDFLKDIEVSVMAHPTYDHHSALNLVVCAKKGDEIALYDTVFEYEWLMLEKESD